MGPTDDERPGGGRTRASVRVLAVVVAALLLVGCAGSPGDGGLDPTGAHAAAIEAAVIDIGAGPVDVWYVAGPSGAGWPTWCGFDDFAACDELGEYLVDLPATFLEGDPDVVDEIEDALGGITEIEFIEDPDEVIVPGDHPGVRDNGGLLVIGVMVEADGSLWVPVESASSGGLYRLDPDGSGGWTVEQVTMWIA